MSCGAEIATSAEAKAEKAKIRRRINSGINPQRKIPMTLFKPTTLLTTAALTFAFAQGKDLKQHEWPQIGTPSAFAATANSSSYALTFNTVTDEPIPLILPVWVRIRQG
jgi:hypothetical protein